MNEQIGIKNHIGINDPRGINDKRELTKFLKTFAK